MSKKTTDQKAEAKRPVGLTDAELEIAQGGGRVESGDLPVGRSQFIILPKPKQAG